MAKNKPRPEEQQRPMLGVQERNYMIINMLRKVDSFDRAQQLLTVSHFTPEEKWLATLWTCAIEHFREFNELPGKETLVARFNAKFEEDPEAYSDDDLAEADEFISTLFAMDESGLNDKVAFGWLKKFLEDRLVDSIRETLTTPMTPADITANLGVWTQTAANYQSLDGKRISVAFPDNWDQDETAFIDKRPTGLSLFDSFMGGGDAAGESYGLLGPYAGGKTTLAVMLTTLRAKLAYASWLEAGREGSYGLSFHFTYEEGLGSLRLRALSYIAEIPRTTLETAIATRDYSIFSRTGNLKPYEQRKYAPQLHSGHPVYGEFERFRRAQRMLNKCWRVVDMTGADPDYPGRGTGMVDEVAAIIRQEVTMASREGEQVHVDIALVDYVLACIERHTDDREALRHMIRNFPMQMKHKVAIPFHCPAWSMHQLDTKAQALPPGRMPNKTDASEGRAFAERLDFLFAIGNATREGYAAFGPLKVRRVKMLPPIVAEIDGDNAAVLDRRDEYSINERTHRIMPVGESRVIGGAHALEDVVNNDEEDNDAADTQQVNTLARQQQAIRPRRSAT